MRLLFVIDNLSTGGSQRQICNLALGLSQRGHVVEVFCYAPGDLLAKPLIEAGIRIHWHTKRNRLSLDVILAISRLIQKNRYDLVLAYLPGPNIYSIIASRLIISRKVPVVVSERSGEISLGVYRFSRIQRQLYRLAARVVANSHHQRIYLENNYPYLKDRLSTIYNGYDLDYFTPAETEPNNHPLQIICIASVSPHKNGLCLVEALHILKKDYDQSPIVDWVGQLVMQGYRLEYLNEMKQLITKYGLDEQWHWLNQRLDIVDLLHQHDVLVHASNIEGLPNVVCEALACARPVIISDTLDHPRLVQDGISGYLFDWQNPGDLAEKIARFTNLPLEKKREMGRNGRLYAEANLSLKLCIDKYESLFMEIIRK